MNTVYNKFDSGKYGYNDIVYNGVSLEKPKPPVGGISIKPLSSLVTDPFGGQALSVDFKIVDPDISRRIETTAENIAKKLTQYDISHGFYKKVDYLSGQCRTEAAREIYDSGFRIPLRFGDFFEAVNDMDRQLKNLSANTPYTYTADGFKLKTVTPVDESGEPIPEQAHLEATLCIERSSDENINARTPYMVLTFIPEQPVKELEKEHESESIRLKSNKKSININRILSEGDKILDAQSKSYEYADGLSY